MHHMYNHLPQSLFNEYRLRRTAWLSLVVLAAFGLRVYHLAVQSFWWDEMFTAGISSLPIADIMQESLADRVHPPLYALLMHGWSRIGINEFILRYFSVIWGVLAVPAIYRTGRLVNGHRTGCAAAFLLAISPFHIWHSQDARMYSLVMTLILAANGFLIMALRRDSRLHWRFYAAFMLLAIYTHYLSLFVLLAHYTFFAVQYRQLKAQTHRWAAYSGLVLTLFLPWIYLIMSTGGFSKASIGWVPPASWAHPFFTLLALSAGSTIDPGQLIPYITLFIYSAALILVAIRFSRRSSGHGRLTAMRSSRMLFCWLLVPLLLVLLISLDWPVPQKRSIYMDRYLIILLPALILLAGWGLVSALRSRPGLLLAVLAVICLVSAVSLGNLYFDPSYSRTNWRQALTQIKSEWQPADKLLINPEQILPILYYQNGQLPYELLPSPTSEDEVSRQAKLNAQMALFDEEDNRVWLIEAFANNDPHGFPQSRNEEVANASNDSGGVVPGYQPTEQWTFTGIQIWLYDISD